MGDSNLICIQLRYKISKKYYFFMPISKNYIRKSLHMVFEVVYKNRQNMTN